MMDFLQAAFPWVAMGIVVAIYIAFISLKQKKNKINSINNKIQQNCLNQKYYQANQLLKIVSSYTANPSRIYDFAISGCVKVILA